MTKIKLCNKINSYKGGFFFSLTLQLYNTFFF
uniref:Uncharacterized protein n=1 Tax=Anguilla anguilla TaxID=7936 RepID=A0A0E9ULS8_ANGAN